MAVQGPVGAEVQLSLRAGDGWNVGPVLWSTLFTKTFAFVEVAEFDVSGLGLELAAGETFVIEAQGTDTGAELVGSYVNPLSGAPNYAEELFLSGPGCYDDCGWRMGFRTWMATDAPRELVRLGSPPNPNALLVGQTSAPVLGAVWDPRIDHAAFLPGAHRRLARDRGRGRAGEPADGLRHPALRPCRPARSPSPRPRAPPSPCRSPRTPAFVGREFCAQGISAAPGTYALTNALDITIGSD